jgi:hypothetical protein
MLLRTSPLGEEESQQYVSDPEYRSDVPTEIENNIPTSETLPNEALKVIQEDADMTNTDLDPEAGFISQADIDANQQMGSPTSQGFMSKYGENDQDLLQTT